MKYETIVYFIYWWSRGIISHKFCQQELSISSPNVIVNWNYMREVCAQVLLMNPVRIGGEGLHVEIDESLFVRQKANVGRVPSQQWVMGGVCRENNECFLYAVEDRSAATLNSITENSGRPGTIIITDEWRRYNNVNTIQNMNFTHLTVNHSEKFVNPASGACTNRVEGLWNIAKMENKKRWGLHRQTVDSYLCEFMWRRRNLHEDLFDAILRDIVICNPL